jgi:hypothetical protein
MRDRQLRYYPTCVVCGEKASHADHVLAIANGGTTDGRLQSMCRQAPPREDRPGQPRGRQAGGRKTKGEAAMNRTTFSSFGRRKKRPSKPFIHQEGCKIAEVDPGVEIPWSYLGDGFWKAECVCGFETFTEPLIDDRVRLDPLDPRTGRHLGQCEYVSETDPAVLKVLLKVKPGMGEGYDWVECNGCDMGWQVAHFAESVG